VGYPSSDLDFRVLDYCDGDRDDPVSFSTLWDDFLLLHRMQGMYRMMEEDSNHARVYPNFECVRESVVSPK
jgi:hypothetical protein